jgi:hypothetical protein
MTTMVMDSPEGFSNDDSGPEVPRMTSRYLAATITVLIGGFIATWLTVAFLFLPLVNVVDDLASQSKPSLHRVPAWATVVPGVIAILVWIGAVALTARGATRDRYRRWLWFILLAIAISGLIGQTHLVTFIIPRFEVLYRDLGH